MSIRTKIANGFVRWFVGGRARWINLPRASRGLMKSAARTPANCYELNRTIGEGEEYWAEVLQTWSVAELTKAATMLSRGQNPGFDIQFMGPATSQMFLLEIRRRWKSEAADDVRTGTVSFAD